MMPKRMIYVTFRKRGLHRFPDAPAEVAYLAQPHRHTFWFKVSIEVHHNDRDIEFHLFQQWLESLYETGLLMLDGRSCETMAEELYERISERHSGRSIEIDISEDGENGAILSWP
jgi:hypothetical protein